MNLSVILLHENMHDKHGKIVTTSLTMIDAHDIARSSKTYGIKNFYIAHPSETIRNLAQTLKTHWLEGFGSTYNTNRKEAMELVKIVTNLSEAVNDLEFASGSKPKLVATSAKAGGNRISYKELSELSTDNSPYLLMLGTGWGLSDFYLEQTDYYLAPILGPTEYNHLSVRSACGIMLDRLVGK